jgi:RNA polymerase sigma factor (sigma-70 family)
VSADAESAELVRAAQRGDTIAMSVLLDRLAPYVGRICGPIAFVSGPDAAQETLISVFRNLRSLREPEALYGWVRSIAVREAVRLAGRDQRAVPMEIDDHAVAGDDELVADVRDQLARLSPEHRAVLVLRELEGLTEEQTAQLLKVPQGTVKSRLHRARDSFRKAWTQ